MGTRRSFFYDVTALSALGALVQQEGHAQVKDDQMVKFWDAYFDEMVRDPAQGSKGVVAPGVIDPNRDVLLMHSTKDGLRLAEKIADSELKDSPDVVLNVTAGHFNPNLEDSNLVKKIKGCQVRLDWYPHRPVNVLLPTFAWAGLAAWSAEKTVYDPKTKKTTYGPNPPDLKTLDFRDPSDTKTPVNNDIILKGGSGKLALNVSAVKQHPLLKNVLDRGVQYASIAAPFFGFAPLAIPALRTLTSLLGAMFTHEAVILNSLPRQIHASKEAKNGPSDMNTLNLVSGDFIAVPKVQGAGLELDKLRIDKGYLVHQDANKNKSAEENATDKNVPNVTYMSMQISVEALYDAEQRKSKGG